MTTMWEVVRRVSDGKIQRWAQPIYITSEADGTIHFRDSFNYEGYGRKAEFFETKEAAEAAARSER